MRGLWNLLTNPSYVAKTGGDVVQQHIGRITEDGLGETFASNVFGHFIIVRELENLLLNGKILWFSSTTADVSFFDPSDYQCIQGSHPYESSKRLCELLSFHFSKSLKNKRIQSLVCSPGNCFSNITQGTVNAWLLMIAYYIMRWCFCSGINVSSLFISNDSKCRSLRTIQLLLPFI